MTKYDVKLHVTAFHSVKGIEAQSEQEALAKAMTLNYQKLL